MTVVEIHGVEDLLNKLNLIMTQVQVGIDESLTTVGNDIVDNAIGNLREDLHGPWPRTPDHKYIVDKDNWTVTSPESSKGVYGREVVITSEAPHSFFVERGTGDGIKPDKGPVMKFRLKDGRWATATEVKGQSPKHFLGRATIESDENWPSYMFTIGTNIFRRLTG
jgi:hypothetical protein